jgi:hypothetical protein
MYHFGFSENQLNCMDDNQWASWHAILNDIRKEESIKKGLK